MENELTENEKAIIEKQSEIAGLKNLLEQGDYRARKLIAEVCAVVHAQFPTAPMPVYEGYLAQEKKAQEFRDKINKLEDEITELGGTVY